MTGSGRAGVLMGVAAPRTGPVLSTVTIAQVAFEWECRACHRWRPLDDDDLCQDCVVRLAAVLAECSTPPRVSPIGAPHLPHRRVKPGSS